MSMKVNLMSQSNEVHKNDRGMSKVHRSHSEESTARKTWDSMSIKTSNLQFLHLLVGKITPIYQIKFYTYINSQLVVLTATNPKVWSLHVVLLLLGLNQEYDY